MTLIGRARRNWVRVSRREGVATWQASLKGLRIGRWTAAAALLPFPLVMMRVGREWHWDAAIVAGIAIGAVLLVIELPGRKSGDPAYRAGVTIGLAAALLLIWINMVTDLTGDEDNPAGAGLFVLVLMAGVGAFAVRARPDGLARAMAGVAAVQAILTALVTTDPSTASEPRGLPGVPLLSGYFTALWLVAAAAFRQAARRRTDPAQALA